MALFRCPPSAMDAASARVKRAITAAHRDQNLERFIIGLSCHLGLRDVCAVGEGSRLMFVFLFLFEYFVQGDSFFWCFWCLW